MKTRTLPLFILLFFHINLACTSNVGSLSATYDDKTQEAPPSTPQPLPQTDSQGETDLTNSIPTGRQVMKTLDGRSMVYEFQPGTKPSVWLLIHGLADNMTMLQDLSRLANEAGHSVLRIDLHGHGETLKEYLKDNSELPEKLDYFANVADLQLILANLNIKELTIVGHSYGGAIAYGLAAELKREGKIRVQSLHMLAPYVQRIDKFLRENSIFPMPTSGDDSSRDALQDPFLDLVMEKLNRSYIVESQYGNSTASLTPEQKKEIDYKVKTAILATKGIRTFDLLDKANALPAIDTPLQVIGGKKDQLVLPKQLKAFEKRLKAEKMSYVLEFLDGPNSDHLFPRKVAEDTFKMILHFQSTLNQP